MLGQYEYAPDAMYGGADETEAAAPEACGEGIVPDAVALTLGFGHTALDAFSRHKGANVAELFTTAPEAGTGLTVWNRLGVSIARV